jgi:pilus assembly protein CpaF
VSRTQRPPDDEQPATGSTRGQVVGEECDHGLEVLGLVQALNTGHDGSLSTCHANSALDAVHRLETLVVQAAPTWPLPAVRSHLLRCVDVIVHVERSAGGGRRVVEIAELDAPGDLSTDRDRPLMRPVVSGDAIVGTLQRSRAWAR